MLEKIKIPKRQKESFEITDKADVKTVELHRIKVDECFKSALSGDIYRMVKRNENSFQCYDFTTNSVVDLGGTLEVYRVKANLVILDHC